MPSQIAHDERRRRIAELSCTLIARHGLDGLTIRTVAAAVGFSTAVVTHYFHNKRDLLLHTYEFAAARTVNRNGDETVLPGAVATLLAQMLPADPIAIENWRVFVAYWGAAAGDDELAAEQRRHVQKARALIVERLPPRGDAWRDAIARRLLATVMGIATQAIFDPGEWPPQRQFDLLSATIADLRLAA